MKISFIIPAYNEEKNISKCIISILNQIQKIKHKNIDTEIIVVNNNSTDRTKEIALSFDNVIVVDEVKKGVVYARTAGYKASSGDLLANIDADNIMTDGWINLVISRFKENKNLVALSGPLVYYDLPKYQQILTLFFYYCGYFVHWINKKIGKGGIMLQGGNYVVKKTALDAVGGYNLNFEFYGEDTSTAYKLRAVGDVEFDFNLKINSSGRRLSKQGLIKTGFYYAISYFYVLIFNKPFTKKYVDIREN